MIPSTTLPDVLLGTIQSATRALVDDQESLWDASTADCLERIFQDAQMPVSPTVATRSQRFLSGHPLHMRFNLD